MQDHTVTFELDQSRWDAFVEGSAEATPYHRYSWRRVIEESFGHRGHYLAALDGAGAVRGILPLVHMRSALFGNFLVSVPFVNYGGLLCNSDGAGAALVAAAERLRSSLGAGHVEMRHLAFKVGGLPARTHKVTMVLPLQPDAQSQWDSFNAKLRNQIRKAEKSGLTCTIGHLDLLDDFYDVFARNMRDLGTPVYGKEFFRNVLRAFPEHSKIFAVMNDGRTIAAGIVSWYRRTTEMPWASSIREYKPLCPNNLLYWEAIRFAIDKGCASFDFGRSTPEEGTFNFKKQWGAQPVQLYWQYLLPEGEPLPELSPKNPKFEAAIALWKRLPVGMTRILGPAIVRNIP
ncbi:FemAB family PEP-CTERM system-associated protein [Geomonas sp. RF6]|uniref:FemAB family XrtA/PEP-CTERM system-associated protein n=1 Tax=Geomonas sp. RF6 TaxID=2897342 RepID=UPI001E5147A6|nr:FemAB family XrtA/PEP-CTERM system-associated protein [Geomonas sp. RF6]UFS69122.1 FemAB family PEP-CTERM system-associated protein [Geomonas sp. RF6]